MIIDTRGIDGALVALTELNKEAGKIVAKGIRAEANQVNKIAKESLPADPLSRWSMYSWIERDRTTNQRDLQWDYAKAKASIKTSVRNKKARTYRGAALKQRTDVRLYSSNPQAMIYQTTGNGESNSAFVRTIERDHPDVNDRFLYGARNTATFAKSVANINALLASASAQVQRMLNKMEGE